MNSSLKESLSIDKDHWDMIIEPKRHLLDLKLGDLWRYKDLVILFVRRDFVSVYKQTILGPLWYIIQPVLTTVIFTFIFGSVASLPTDGSPKFLFYMSGTVVWSYFASCLTKTSDTFITNIGLFGKVYFPRLTVPFSVLISSLIAFLIQVGLFLGFVVYFLLLGTVIHPSWLGIALSPILVLIMAGLGMGLGIIISSLTTKYRDLRFLVGFGVSLLMYTTPVILPISSIPARFRWVILSNPMTSIVEAFRYAALGAGSLNFGHLLYSFVFMIVVVFLGIIIFNRVEQTFMDTV